MKLSCKQLDLAQENPKEVAKMLMLPKNIKGGFNKVTHEVCYSMAKGALNYQEAKATLNMRLLEKFKDTPKNRKRIIQCQNVLSDFYAFLQQEGLSCLLNHSQMRIPLGDGNLIAGYGCAIFKNQDGMYKGVILTDREFNFASTLRLPIEQYWIAQKLRLNNTDLVEMYIYYTNDSSYESVVYPKEKIDYVLAKSNYVIRLVEIEVKKIG